MKENIEILLNSEKDMNWTTYKDYAIMLSGSIIGYIMTYNITKEGINDNIYEDHAFYMSEETKIKGKICNLMYKNMANAEVVFVHELFLNKDYRRQGIGSVALQEIERLNPNCAFMLLASALEDIHEFIVNESYRNDIMEKLYKFYGNNGYNHYQAVFYKGIDFLEESWNDYNNYEE